MRALLPLLLLLSVAAQAEIYQCEIDGRKTFSQQPCGKEARSITLDHEARKLIIPDEVSEDYAYEFCGMAAKAWDKAATSNRSAYEADLKNRNYDRYGNGDVVYTYMKEHIANFYQVSRRDPTLQARMLEASRALNAMARIYPNPTPGQIDAFTRECAEATLKIADNLKNGGNKKPEREALPRKAEPVGRKTY